MKLARQLLAEGGGDRGVLELRGVLGCGGSKPLLSAESWADHSLKGVDLGIWHLVTASEVMSWE
jgi:hypothetical protein